MQATRKNKEDGADSKSRPGSDTNKSGRAKKATGDPRATERKDASEADRKTGEESKDAVREAAAPDDARPDSTEKSKDGQPPPKGARIEKGEPSKNEPKDRRLDQGKG